MIKDDGLELICSFHNQYKITHGCNKQDCEQESLFCSECMMQRIDHLIDHKEFIMPIEKFIYQLNSSLSNTNNLITPLKQLSQGIQQTENQFEGFIENQKAIINDNLKLFCDHIFNQVENLRNKYFNQIDGQQKSILIYLQKLKNQTHAQQQELLQICQQPELSQTLKQFNQQQKLQYIQQTKSQLNTLNLTNNEKKYGIDNTTNQLNNIKQKSQIIKIDFIKKLQSQLIQLEKELENQLFNIFDQIHIKDPHPKDNLSLSRITTHNQPSEQNTLHQFNPSLSPQNINLDQSLLTPQHTQHKTTTKQQYQFNQSANNYRQLFHRQIDQTHIFKDTIDQTHIFKDTYQQPQPHLQPHPCHLKDDYNLAEEYHYPEHPLCYHSLPNHLIAIGYTSSITRLFTYSKPTKQITHLSTLPCPQQTDITSLSSLSLPYHTLLITADRQGQLAIWNLSTTSTSIQSIQSIQNSHLTKVIKDTGMAMVTVITNIDNLFMAGDSNGSLTIWDVNQDTPIQSNHIHTTSILNIIHQQSQQQIYVCCKQIVTIWTTNKQIVCTQMIDTTQHITSIWCINNQCYFTNTNKQVVHLHTLEVQHDMGQVLCGQAVDGLQILVSEHKVRVYNNNQNTQKGTVLAEIKGYYQQNSQILALSQPNYTAFTNQSINFLISTPFTPPNTPTNRPFNLYSFYP